MVRIARALRRHGWVLVLALAISGLAAWAATRLMQPVYQAAATVELDTPTPAVQFPGGGSAAPDMATEPGTVAEELANPDLVGQAAARVGPALSLRFWRRSRAPMEAAELTAAASRQFQVIPVPHSRIIQLQFQAPSPGLAASFLDQLLAGYRDAQRRNRRNADLERVNSLSGRVDAARAQVNAAQAQLEPFTAQGPAPPAALQLAQQRRQQLEQAETAAEIAALQQADVLAASSAASAATPADLEVKQAELEAEIKRLQTIYQPQAAPLRQARQQLAGLQASVGDWRER